MQKFKPLGIDHAGVKQYFNKLREVSSSEQTYWESIEIMVDVILHEFEASEVGDSSIQLMCIRGLLMLCMNEKFADFMGQGVSEKILTVLIDILGDAISPENREITDLNQHVAAI